MENLIIISVLFAAFLHAFWNFLLRNSNDKTLSMVAVVLGHLPGGIIGIIIFGFPNLESFKFIVFSVIFHFFYQVFLLNAYKHAQLSQVYPVARGLSPLIIILISSLYINEVFTKFELLGMILISSAILAYGILINNESKDNLKGFLFSIITGIFIALYSIVDGYGARISQNPIGFYSSLTILNAIFFLIYSIIFQKGKIRKLFYEGRSIFFIGGTSSYVAYGIVVWACVYLPIAVVSSLRETSILFVLLFSTFLLKEKLTLFKISIISIILIGIVLIRSSI